MGYSAYGTDLEPRMVEYTEKNLRWLQSQETASLGRVAVAHRHGDGALILALPRSEMPRASRSQAPDSRAESFQVTVGDATAFTWEQPIDAVACEGYLGRPMSLPPAEIKLKTEEQECSSIILEFLKNLAPQIKSNTPVVVAMPAWLRPDGSYHRMNLVDEIANLGYNVMNKTREGLIYHRDKQVVARDIIILRKK